MKCPHCHSENIDQTGKMDLTVIDRTECRHDFECFDCGALFVIIYAPIATQLVEVPEEVAS